MYYQSEKGKQWKIIKTQSKGTQKQHMQTEHMSQLSYCHTWIQREGGREAYEDKKKIINLGSNLIYNMEKNKKGHFSKFFYKISNGST